MMFSEAPSDVNALYWYGVKVERVVDGDTIVGSLALGFHLGRTKQYFRLAFINTPERGEDGFEEAKQFLADKVEGKDIMVLSKKDSTGRYKRIVAELFIDGENINRALLEAGHAKLVDY